MKNIRTKLLAGLIAFSAFNISHAATSTATMQVTATVEGACTLTTTNMNFGSFQVGSPNGTTIYLDVNAEAIVNVNCAQGVVFTLKWDGGLNFDGNYRRLKHATLNQYLNYQIDLGDGTGMPPGAIHFSGTGSEVDRFVFGTLSRNQAASPGNYSDLVTLTIEY